MRLARLTSAITVVCAVSVLVACGGGGGTTPNIPAPSNSPGGPPPATSTPSPAPSGSPTAKPTGQPTQSPTQQPTVQPTATPTQSPTPSPTPSPSPNPSTTPFAYSWELGGAGTSGVTNGLDGQFTTSAKNLNQDPHDGDFMPGDPGALAAGGGQGPTGNTVDNIPCEITMPTQYHVHAFVGLFVNGKQIALPDAIGIVNPHGEFTDSDGWMNQEIYGNCFYHIHTHDSSGLVHIEDQNTAGVPITGTIFNLQNFLDIWGISVTPMSFGTFPGPVTVYTSGQFARGPCSGAPGSCEVGSTNYSVYTGSYSNLSLYSHEVIWFEVGSGNPDAIHLPGINFDVTQ